MQIDEIKFDRGLLTPESSKAIAKQQELRIGVKDDVIGIWDYLTPVYPQFHEDDKTTSLIAFAFIITV